MPVLCDAQIRELIDIKPFAEGQKRPGKVSFGLSSYGYDIRVGTRFKIFTPTPRSGGITVVDPKAFHDDLFVEVDCALPPAKGQGRPAGGAPRPGERGGVGGEMSTWPLATT